MLPKKLGHVTGVDTSDLAPKKDFIVLKAVFEKLDLDKLVNVPTSVNKDDLDVGKLKTVPVDLKKLSDIIANEVIKNKK